MTDTHDSELNTAVPFSPLRATSTAMLAEILSRQPTSPAKIECAWRLAAGERLARAARVHADVEGTLRIEVADAAWRAEVRRARPVLLDRLRALLGAAVVTRLAIVAPGDTRSSHPHTHA
jgi:predicted nucleic acid-binding Zn ribbon protein